MSSVIDERGAPAPARARRARVAWVDLALMGGAGMFAAACAVATGGSGLLAVGALVAAVAGVAAAWHWRAWLRPLRPGASFPEGAPALAAGALAGASRRTDVVMVAASAVAAAGLAVFAGSLGLKGAALAVALVGGAAVAVIWRRELLGMALGSAVPAAAPAWRRRALVGLPDALRRPPALSGRTAIGVGTVLVAGGAAAAWMAASLGIKGAALLVAVLGLGVLLTFVRDREDLMLFVLVCSLVLFLHKSLGAMYPVNSGAPALYITSLGLLLVVLYALWGGSGRLGAQLSAAMRRTPLLVPLAGALLMLPSLLSARDLVLAGAELLRMAWMYLLFVYIAVRVRRTTQVWAILGGLAVVASVELVVVALQFKTGGALGLGFLGVPAELGERVVDGGTLGRPFGTLVHPVFLGALMGSLGLLSLSIGLALRNPRRKVMALAFVPVCTLTLLLSQARVALVVFVVMAAAVLVTSTAQGRLSRRALGRTALAGLAVSILASPYLWAQYQEHFQSDHVSVEVESRMELNQVAFEMLRDHPVAGVGLNHFQDAMGPYDRYGLLFAGNPVHNLYLLQASETGYVGLLGLLLVGAVFLRTSLRLARVEDPLLGGLGTGISAVFAFFAVEELAGFSLRQEIPLALWWILAGLAVAGLAMAERSSRHVVLPRRRPRRPPSRTTRSVRRPAARGSVRHTAPPISRRRPRRSTVVRIVLAVTIAGGTIFASPSGAGAVNESLRDARIVFAATDAVAGGAQAIFTASTDGTDITRISPDDGAAYDFPTWAMGGSKVVYSRREPGPLAPENIWMADADGSDPVQLTFSPWRNHQPKVNAAGTRLIFSGFVPGTRLVAIYELDLATLLVRNVSAVHSTSVVADADPRFTTDGSIVFARSRSDDGEATTQAWLMAADGTGRRRISDDAFYDVDPAMSPDLGSVAFSSYRGEGTPQDEALNGLAKHRDFHLAVRDLATGEERTLTGGQDCLARPAEDPCSPAEASAYVPVWTPDGSELGFVAPLSRAQVCICTIGVDGSEPKILLAAPGLNISWFDWVVPAEVAPSAVLHPGAARPDGRLIVAGTETLDPDGPETRVVPFIATSGEDWWDRQSLSSTLAPRSVRWAPDRSQIAIVAATAMQDVAGPARSARRRVHITLPELGLAFRSSVDRPEVAALQVFLVDSDGETRQVTDPWIEDPLDALAPGDARGNLDPDISPDGRHLLVTNVSATTSESFILRIDLETGDVLNLTNVTSGALPVDDAQPRWSPDGRTIAFTSGFEGQTGVYLMDATGSSVRRLSEGESFDVSPAWSPDGRFVVYSSYTGDMLPLLESLSMPEQLRRIPQDGWSLVRVDVLTGERQVLTTPAASPALSPVWSPDGDDIAFLSVTDGFQPDLYVVPASGGDARLVQITGLLQELSIDWR